MFKLFIIKSKLIFLSFLFNYLCKWHYHPPNYLSKKLDRSLILASCFSYSLYPTRQQVWKALSPFSLSLHFSSAATTCSKPPTFFSQITKQPEGFFSAFTLASLNPFFTNQLEQSFNLNHSVLISLFERNPLMVPHRFGNDMQMAPSCTVLNLISDLYGLCPPFCVISMAFIAVQQANPFVLSTAAWKEHSSSTSFTWLILFFFFRLGLMLPWRPLQTFFLKIASPYFSSYWFHFIAFFST